jgi:hypothetical protein
VQIINLENAGTPVNYISSELLFVCLLERHNILCQVPQYLCILSNIILFWYFFTRNTWNKYIFGGCVRAHFCPSGYSQE